MSSTSERSLAVAGVRHAAAVLVDAACDVCAACAAGARLHCTRPLVEGRQLTAPMPRVVAEEMLEAVTAVAALVEAPPVGTVVVAAPADSSLAVLVRAVAPPRSRDLMQRLVAPLDAAAVLGRVSTQVWSAAVAAAA